MAGILIGAGVAILAAAAAGCFVKGLTPGFVPHLYVVGGVFVLLGEGCPGGSKDVSVMLFAVFLMTLGDRRSADCGCRT